MLIRTQREITQLNRDHEKKHAGQQILCAHCAQFIGSPPAIQTADYQMYHVKCAMEITYDILESLSGYDPVELKHESAIGKAYATATHPAQL